jgi:hypothetical protein
MIVHSAYQLGAVQADGRTRVTETHTLNDGGVPLVFEYDAGENVDPNLVMIARAERLNAEFAARDAALAEAQNGSIGLTKYQFRQLFAPAERIAVDAFNDGGYLVSQALTDTQKAAVKLALADWAVTSVVHLDNSDVIAMVNLYESLGLIAPGRAAEILSG